MTYITIVLPLEGKISGGCSTDQIEAVDPEAAAAKALEAYDPKTLCLVTDGVSYTHAFRKRTSVELV